MPWWPLQCLGSHLLSGGVMCVDRIDRQARQAVLQEKKMGQLEEAESSRPWLAFWLDFMRCYQKGLLQPISAGFLFWDTFLVNLSRTLWAGTFIYLSCLLVDFGWVFPTYKMFKFRLMGPAFVFGWAFRWTQSILSVLESKMAMKRLHVYSQWQWKLCRESSLQQTK